MTDASGLPVRSAGYLPYGGVLYEDGVADKLKFTTYERDSGAGETGLDYAMFRHYSSGLGGFMSADLLAGNPGAPQSLNRYAYAMNDPVNLVDPLGLRGISAMIFVCTDSLTYMVWDKEGNQGEVTVCVNGQFVTFSDFGEDGSDPGGGGGGGGPVALTRKLLQGNSDCAKFFNQAANKFLNGGSGSPSPADDMLSSDNIVTVTNLPSQIKKEGDKLRQPPGATTTQGAGFGATINLNAYGAFYNESAFVQGTGQRRPLSIGGTANPYEFAGNTLGAQVTILLHELAHTMDLIPSDGTSPTQSLQNTKTILDKCKDAIKALLKGAK